MPSDSAEIISGITTREYKLILDPGRFSDRETGSNALRGIVELFAAKHDIECKLQSDEKIRQTYYLDTDAFHLRKAGYALRVRREEDADDTRVKVTLKHRTRDRYIANEQDLSVADGSPSLKFSDADPKFEEDILPPFRSIFSRSVSLKMASDPKIRSWEQLTGTFPGLDSLQLSDDTILKKVNGFSARERFRELCTFRIAKAPDIKCGLSFWYHSKVAEWPLIAECAFDYKALKDDQDNRIPDCFDIGTVEVANKLYRFLQNQPGWFNLNATTKTRYVYGGLW